MRGAPEADPADQPFSGHRHSQRHLDRPRSHPVNDLPLPVSATPMPTRAHSEPTHCAADPLQLRCGPFPPSSDGLGLPSDPTLDRHQPGSTAGALRVGASWDVDFRGRDGERNEVASVLPS